MQVKNLHIPVYNYDIDADFYEGASTETIILTLIGWTSNKDRYREILNNITEKCGVSALVFDYSGHGNSEFSIEDTRPAAHFLEVISVFDWLKEQYPESKIIVFGTSYGGFMATQLTIYRSFEKLVLRVPAIYRPEDFYSQPKVWDRQAVTIELRNDASALRSHPLLGRTRKFNGKTMVIVHDRDEYVPPPTTDAYIEAFSADSLHFDVKHGTSEEPVEWIRDYSKQIARWIAAN